MKKLIILLAGMVMLSCNETADTDDTAEVSMSPMDIAKEAFASDHAGVNATEWEEENGMYEVSFMKDGVEHSIVYNSEGNIVEEEHELNVDELPEAVKTSANNAGAITEACKVTKADGTISYEVEIDGKDMVYDAEGNLLGTEEDEDDDNEDDE